MSDAFSFLMQALAKRTSNQSFRETQAYRSSSRPSLFPLTSKPYLALMKLTSSLSMLRLIPSSGV